MAQGPWRCSQCGTINEPVANSCRTCGKWPSLFDLEDSALDESELAEHREDDAGFPAIEQRTVEAPPFEPPAPAAPSPFPEEVELEPEVFDDVEEAEPPRRRWTSAIIPIAVLLYFLISAIVER